MARRRLSGADSVGFAWLPLLAFVRLSSKEGLFPHPLRPKEATGQVADWLAAPSAALLNSDFGRFDGARWHRPDSLL